MVAQYHDLEAQREQIVERQDAIKATLRALLPIGSHEAGGGVVVITAPAKRFDAKRAESVLPPEALAQVTRPVVDRALAQTVLPPALYAWCQVESPGAQPSVRIK